MVVVFFGTPAFAVPSLTALLHAGHRVAAVVTQPDRPQGRSRSTLVPPPVKVAALEAGLDVWQPERPAGAEFEADLSALGADLGVVVAYGHILRSHGLAIPRLGMVNVHASLLPRWRGAAPIQWAIKSGDDLTGVSIMRMEAGLDSGPVWLTMQEPVSDTTTAGALTPVLAQLGAEALLAALPRIEAGEAPRPQDQSAVTLAPKVGRDIARIDWKGSARDVARHINAFDPAPGAWTGFEGSGIKLFAAEPRRETVTAAAGAIVGADATLDIATGSGVVAVHEVQLPGRKRQPVTEWLRGRPVEAGTKLG